MPDNDKPEKIVLTGTKYSDNQFTVELEASFGIATAGANASFQISTTLVVADANGNELARLQGNSAVQKQRDDGSPGGVVALVPQVIPWTGRTYTGEARVSTSSELQTNGSTVGNSQAERSDAITVPPDR
jgi:hypothetical protein